MCHGPHPGEECLSGDKIHNGSLSGLNEGDREAGSNKLRSVIFSMGGSDTAVNKYNKSTLELVYTS